MLIAEPISWYISIHAPMRGATLVQNDKNTSSFISIHAPMRGATGTSYTDTNVKKAISIHAPMRGATLRDIVSLL